MRTIILMTVIIAGIGCGIKGPPLPPLETVNERANNLNAEETASAVSSDNTTIQKDRSK